MAAPRAALARRAAMPLAVTLAAAAAGCAPSTEGSRAGSLPSPADTGTAACFYAGQVSDFTVLDRSNLIVYAPSKQSAYHVRISPPAIGLRSADRLSFGRSDARICGYAGERLIVPDGRGGERYSIVGVARLTQAGLEALLFAAGRSAGPGPADAAEPEPAGGADIQRELEQEPP